MTGTVTRLSIYPVKSLGGFDVASWEVDAFGPRLDRRWMVLDAEGDFLTQRWRPRMALVRASLGEDGTVRLAAPGMRPVAAPQGGGPGRTARVWNDAAEAEGCGPDADRWLSEFLGEPCSLVFMPERTVRRIALRREEALGRVSFADAYPFLLFSEASLADLNARLAEPLPHDRFRPNIMVDGVAPFAEDAWDRIVIGDLPLVATKRCVRCVLTTIDQDTAAIGKEPLRTLATYRRADGGVVFGVNLAHQGTGRLAVGDAVRATPHGMPA
ncbi:MAG TPA: MOSC N-terminal beta barrel domain-containing protein [Gemmatimonadales bacterium]